MTRFRWAALLLAGLAGPLGADTSPAAPAQGGVGLACGDVENAAEAAARVGTAQPALYWRRSRFGVQGRGSWVRFVPSAVA